VQFAWTFGVWIAAEAIGLSGILTRVAFAFVSTGMRMPTRPSSMRLTTNCSVRSTASASDIGFAFD
jgi:NhaP-type Na+/H+ or K+/H+ antiporter